MSAPEPSVNEIRAAVAHIVGQLTAGAQRASHASEPGDHAASCQHGDTIAEQLGLGEVMGAEHDGAATVLGKLRWRTTNLPCRDRIECRGRLVEQEHIGIRQQHPRTQQPLTHDAGEPRDLLFAAVCQAEQGQGGVDPGVEPTGSTANTTAANLSLWRAVRRTSGPSVTGAASSRRADPGSGASSPTRRRMVVVLPAPLCSSNPTTSRPHLESEVVERDHLAEPLGHNA